MKQALVCLVLVAFLLTGIPMPYTFSLASGILLLIASFAVGLGSKSLLSHARCSTSTECMTWGDRKRETATICAGPPTGVDGRQMWLKEYFRESRDGAIDITAVRLASLLNLYDSLGLAYPLSTFCRTLLCASGYSRSLWCSATVCLANFTHLSLHHM